MTDDDHRRGHSAAPGVRRLLGADARATRRAPTRWLTKAHAGRRRRAHPQQRQPPIRGGPERPSQCRHGRPPRLEVAGQAAHPDDLPDAVGQSGDRGTEEKAVRGTDRQRQGGSAQNRTAAWEPGEGPSDGCPMIHAVSSSALSGSGSAPMSRPTRACSATKRSAASSEQRCAPYIRYAVRKESVSELWTQASSVGSADVVRAVTMGTTAHRLVPTPNDGDGPFDLRPGPESRSR